MPSPHPALRNAAVTATVDSETISFEARLYGVGHLAGSSVEADKIAAYGDPAYSNIPRAVKSYDEFPFTVLNDGSLFARQLESKLSGKVVHLVVTAVYDDGKTEGSSVTELDRDVVVLHVADGGEVTVDSEQKPTIVFTVVPHGPVPATQTSSNSNT